MLKFFRPLILAISLLLWTQPQVLFSAPADTTLNYFQGDWQEAIAVAEQSGKPMMLSIFADWCYWCKAMEASTFKDPEIVSLLNEEFVLYRANAEEVRGGKLAAKFRATSLPVLVFLNTEGQLIEKKTGYIRDNRAFAEELNGFLKASERYKASIDAKILDPGFPDFYLQSFDPEEEWAEEEFKVMAYEFLAQTDKDQWMKEVHWSVMFRFAIVMGEMGSYFLDNYHAFKAHYGKDEAFAHLNNLYNYHMYLYAQRGEEKEALELIGHLKELEADRKDELALRYKVSFYMQSRNWHKVLDQLESHLEKSEDPQLNSVNSVCLNIHDATSDREVLQRTAAVMKTVTEKDPIYQHLDTWAALLFRAGENERAVKAANRAIEVGKKAGIDVTDTEVLLEIHQN